MPKSGMLCSIATQRQPVAAEVPLRVDTVVQHRDAERLGEGGLDDADRLAVFRALTHVSKLSQIRVNVAKWHGVLIEITVRVSKNSVLKLW
jgi:hypothetical protein